ncbi:14132_t:CDS:2 [Funneliformis geosporum]|uniref:81_t:CDS:1 n=1 Tax=Funneliformis geosporum TaxID=1117311 RepID=A0A9W4WM97_9GLOM|nr:14132_t:CDS:2 [Funneliformis geosporum]CAI2172565.1 81_t:CDS:2 [Funneliformis geosporum]
MFYKIISIFGAVGYLGKPDDVSVGMPHGLTTVFGVLFIIMALISIFGIIGSLFSSSGGIRIFEWMLWGIVVVYFIISAVTIFNLFSNKQIAVDRCIVELQGKANHALGDIDQANADKIIVSDVTNATTSSINNAISGELPKICEHREEIRIWVKIVIALLVTLFGAYFAGVVSRFADEIKPATFKGHNRKRNLHLAAASLSTTDVKGY